QVCGDMELIRSTFENVIRNAIRYSPHGSQVTVEAHKANATHAEILVRDHGPGVPEKDLKLIFEPFYRVGSARDRAGGGEGLGLAIAARAVAVHGGAIMASNVPGGGLGVVIELPALPENAASSHKPALVASSAGRDTVGARQSAAVAAEKSLV